MFRKHDQNSSGGKFALQLRLPSGISRKSPRFAPPGGGGGMSAKFICVGREEEKGVRVGGEAT